MNKNIAYGRLVSERKACRLCRDLKNPSRVWKGTFDTKHIGPWSIWHGNLNARLMIIGQDWGDVAYFVANEGFDASNNPTNQRLRMLVSLLGIDIGDPEELGKRGRVFLTNSILCLKSGGLSAKVRSEWFSNCAPFLCKQMEIVAPRVAVCLGRRAYHSVMRAYDLPVQDLSAAVKRRGGVLLGNGTRVFPRFHCGNLGLIRQPFKDQIKDWRRIRPYF